MYMGASATSPLEDQTVKWCGSQPVLAVELPDISMSRNQSHSRKGVANGFANASQAARSISEILLIHDMVYDEGCWFVMMLSEAWEPAVRIELRTQNQNQNPEPWTIVKI